MRTLVVAEPGCTAQGDHATMVELLETAAKCGADVWKPQWTSDPEAMVRRRTARLSPGEAKSFREKYLPVYRWLAWPVEWHADFRERCKARGMQYGCSVYLREDIWALGSLIDVMKFSSFEAMAMDPRDFVSAVEQPAIALISHGMCSPKESRALFRSWRSTRVRHLHCVSAYPASLGQMNLRAIMPDTDGPYWDLVFHGLSDHSRDILTGAVAVGAGCQIIEAHYRMGGCDRANPDYAVSFSPLEFRTYIRNIRKAERIMGSGKKRRMPCEAEMARYRVTG